MDKYLFSELYGILKKLSEDCEEAIKPNECILELTNKSPTYHFRIPEAERRHIIAWGHLRPGGSKKHGVDNPCVTVGVYAGSLNIKQAPFSNHYNPKGNWGIKGMGEVQAAISKAGDENYKIILKALVEASRAALQ